MIKIPILPDQWFVCLPALIIINIHVEESTHIYYSLIRIKMGKIIKVEGWEAFQAKLEELKGNPELFLIFSGSKDEKTGKLT